MERRLFLKGVGGTIFGLPVLESIVFDNQAKAATIPPPYAIFVYVPMGPEIDTWWPKSTGKLTEDSLKGRGTEPMTEFMSRVSIIKGLGHGNERFWNAGDHGESIAMTLSGAVVNFSDGNEGTAKSQGPSIDHMIAKAFQGSSLNLATPDAGGPALSWSGANSANAPEYDPLKAYRTLFPNGEKPGSRPSADPKAELRKGVNSLVREQMKALMSNPKVSKADKERLQLHMDNVRDLEMAILNDLVMSDENREAILKFDSGRARDNSSRRLTYKMHADIIAIAAATGQKRAMTLQLGQTFLDTEYNEDGSPVGGNWHQAVSHGNDKTKLRRFDLLNQKYFAYLLKALDQYKFEDNGKSLMDYGVSTFIISLGFGQAHWRHDLPHILAGSCNGKLKTGQYLDLIAPGANRSQQFVPTNRLFSTIGKAVGAKDTENFNAGTPPKDADKRLDQKGFISEILA